MARVLFTVGATATAALLLSAAAPVHGSETGDVDDLREQVAQLSTALDSLREELSERPSREELAALQQRVEAIDDGAWEEAVELGIVRRFAQAKTGLTPEAEQRAAAAVVREARAAGLDPLLVAAVIEVESTYRNYAVSPVGAVGLMQVMPATGAWFGEKLGKPRTGREELFDPERNIELGVHYLADLKRRFGRMDIALLAYNAGPARAQTIKKGSREELERWLDSYARKVLAAQRRLQRQLAQR
ncbi:lytic transglycosylase domain-containing protein [Vulgatibacter sp.]|uniref:lytic transglycosylase domain-containing protein n=1 Tax=Vulgatibacter sp. TaxID=1971226 RepID=UPI00356817F2